LLNLLMAKHKQVNAWMLIEYATEEIARILIMLTQQYRANGCQHKEYIKPVL